METIKVRTTQNVLIDYPLASVGDRILAYLLDWLILVAYTVGVVLLLSQLEIGTNWLFIVLLSFPWVFYGLSFEILMNGQTPGKRAMNIQVVKLDGTQPTFGNYVLRWIFSFVDIYLLSGVIAILVIAVGGKGQRLGDVVAGTSVIKMIKQQEVTANEVFISADDQYIPTFPQVTQLHSRDIELIQKALEANRNFGNSQPVMLVTEKIKSILGIQSDLPPVQFLYTIVKDYNHFASH